MASLAIALVALGAAGVAGAAEQCDDAMVQMQLQRRRDTPVIPGLGAGGNPTPKMTSSNVVFDNEILSCSDSKYQYGDGYIWTFEQIAEAFLTYGANMFYETDSGPGNLTSQCVAALVIASGECSPVIGQGCNASATGPSGVFQLDFLRTGNTSTVILPQIEADGNIMNLCISGYGAGFLTAPPWYDESNGQVATLEGDSFITCMEAPAYVNNYSCPDPSAVAGVDYSNYIGPFCHKGYDSRYSPCDITSSCCGLWNGGANDYQSYPFPDYYLETAQTQLDAGVDFQGICESVIDSLSSDDSDTGGRGYRQTRRHSRGHSGHHGGHGGHGHGSHGHGSHGQYGQQHRYGQHQYGQHQYGQHQYGQHHYK